MKIQIFGNQADSFFKVRLDLSENMVIKGHTVSVIVPEKDQDKKFKAFGLNYYSIPFNRNGLNPYEDIKLLFQYKKLIKKEKADMLFCYHMKPVIYGGIAGAWQKVKHRYALIPGAGSIFFYDLSQFKKRVIYKLVLFLYKMALKRYQKVIFQNRDNAEMFISLKLVDAKKVEVVNGSGVNMEKFTRQPFPRKNQFLFIGRLLKDKGIFEYMEAAKSVKQKYQDAEFMIIGPLDTNPSAVKLEDLHPYIDNGDIIYCGSTNDVRPYIAACSVFVLPSYHEGVPKTVLEAMAMGRPIITTDIPGCRETVIDGENGFLVPIKNKEALAKKMTWMIENRDRLNEMGNKSLEICREKYDVNKVNKRMLEIMNL